MFGRPAATSSPDIGTSTKLANALSDTAETVASKLSGPPISPDDPVSNIETKDRPLSKKPKQVPFAREAREAAQRREERETRLVEIENMKREREKKLEERDKFRRAMAKARKGGKNGQRKLGRESAILLEKVRRMVED